VTKGRPAKNRAAAVAWLLQQPWFGDWVAAPSYRGQRGSWRKVADGVRDAGIYSRNCGTIDIPVDRIVTEALAIRRAGRP
jgi:hypothetical protein